jgi:hypothetical protein
MDIWTVIRITLSRYYVSLPILLLCMGFGVTKAAGHELAYKATSSAILTGPSLVRGNVAGEVEKINPLMNLGGTLDANTLAVTDLMDSQPKRVEFEARGIDPGYKVTRLESVIMFEVKGPDPESVVANSNALVRLADSETLRLQGESNVDAAPAQRIRVIALAVPQVAAPDHAARAKIMMVFSVLGLLGAIASAIALHGFLRWRSPERADTGRRNARPRSAMPKFVYGTDKKVEPAPEAPRKEATRAVHSVPAERNVPAERTGPAERNVPAERTVPAERNVPAAEPQIGEEEAVAVGRMSPERAIRSWIRGKYGIWPVFELRNKVIGWPLAIAGHMTESAEIRRLRPSVGTPIARVTTVIPTYKRPEALQRAVRSALDQEVTDHIVIVVDDGGGLPELPADPRLIAVSLSANTARLGLVRNVGLGLTRSPYVAFLDDDNEWYPHHLSVALSALEVGVDIVYTGVERVLPDGTAFDLLSVSFDRRTFADEAYVDANSIVMRRDKGVRFSRIHRSKATLPKEDWEFVWRLSRKRATVHLPVTTVRYTVNPDSYYTEWTSIDTAGIDTAGIDNAEIDAAAATLP